MIFQISKGLKNIASDPETLKKKVTEFKVSHTASWDIFVTRVSVLGPRRLFSWLLLGVALDVPICVLEVCQHPLLPWATLTVLFALEVATLPLGGRGCLESLIS
jgi:hypothetical protein